VGVGLGVCGCGFADVGVVWVGRGGEGGLVCSCVIEYALAYEHMKYRPKIVSICSNSSVPHRLSMHMLSMSMHM